MRKKYNTCTWSPSLKSLPRVWKYTEFIVAYFVILHISSKGITHIFSSNSNSGLVMKPLWKFRSRYLQARQCVVSTGRSSHAKDLIWTKNQRSENERGRINVKRSKNESGNGMQLALVGLKTRFGFDGQGSAQALAKDATVWEYTTLDHQGLTNWFAMT